MKVTMSDVRVPRLISSTRLSALLLASLALAGCDGTAGTSGTSANGGEDSARDASTDASTNNSTNNSTNDSTDAEPASPLRIEPTELDMGDLLPNTPVEKSVRLTNTGATPLLIRKALADCGCTTPTWPSDPIAPGASVDTIITMDAGNQQGLVLVKRVTFDLEGADPAFLTVKGRVGSYLAFEPSTVEGPKDDDAEPPAATIVVRSVDGTPFTVVAVDPPIAKALATTPALEQRVEIDWTRWREEGKPVRVGIETDHPIGPPLGILIRRSLRGNPNAPKSDPPKEQ